MLASLAALWAGHATAGELEVTLTVLDPESFATRPPEGQLEWRLQGPGAKLAEAREASPLAVFDLAPGRWQVVVWEAETRAATSFTAQVPESGTAAVAALLSPSAAGVIPAEPEPSKPSPPPAVATEPTLPTPRSASDTDQRSTAGSAALPPSFDTPRSEAAPALAPETIAPLEIVRTFAPGASFSVRLPAVANWSNDLVVIVGGGPGRRATQVRGDLGQIELTAPERPGVYRVEYLAIPEETVVSRTEFIVE
ncbi:hypothetical protein [Halomonas daqiaonensis]|nr:hypothetical protein [Halomonas daqiaonensis]